MNASVAIFCTLSFSRSLEVKIFTCFRVSVCHDVVAFYHSCITGRLLKSLFPQTAAKLASDFNKSNDHMIFKSKYCKLNEQY